MKLYILQELYIIGSSNYWKDIYTNESKVFIKKIKRIYEEKDKQTYRVIEVNY